MQIQSASRRPRPSHRTHPDRTHPAHETHPSHAQHPGRTGSHLPPDTRPTTSPYAAQPFPSPAGNQAEPGPKPIHPRTPDGRFAPPFEPGHRDVRTHRHDRDARHDVDRAGQV